MEVFINDPNKLSHNADGNSDVQIIAYGSGIMLRSETFHFTGQVGTLHSHFHEQILLCERGKLQLIHADGTPGEILNPGDAAYFPPNEMHGVICLEEGSCAIDAFSPNRVDHLLNHLKQLREI